MSKETEAAEKAAAEKAVEEKAAEEAAAAKVAEEEEEEGGEEFDEERARATILKQRAAEKKSKLEAKALKEELAIFRKAEKAKSDADKLLEVKVTEGLGREEDLQGQLADLHVKTDFEGKAAEVGIEDPALAYLAAKEQGLLGEYDPKEGTVGDHDIEALGEAYPSFKPSTVGATGDAGVRGKAGKASTVNAQFNKAIRSRL